MKSNEYLKNRKDLIILGNGISEIFQKYIFELADLKTFHEIELEICDLLCELGFFDKIKGIKLGEDFVLSSINNNKFIVWFKPVDIDPISINIDFESKIENT